MLIGSSSNFNTAIEGVAYLKKIIKKASSSPQSSSKIKMKNNSKNKSLEKILFLNALFTLCP